MLFIKTKKLKVNKSVIAPYHTNFSALKVLYFFHKLTRKLDKLRYSAGESVLEMYYNKFR